MGKSSASRLPTDRLPDLKFTGDAVCSPRTWHENHLPLVRISSKMKILGPTPRTAPSECLALKITITKNHTGHNKKNQNHYAKGIWVDRKQESQSGNLAMNLSHQIHLKHTEKTSSGFSLSRYKILQLKWVITNCWESKTSDSQSIEQTELVNPTPHNSTSRKRFELPESTNFLTQCHLPHTAYWQY